MPRIQFNREESLAISKFMFYLKDVFEESNFEAIQTDSICESFASIGEAFFVGEFSEHKTAILRGWRKNG